MVGEGGTCLCCLVGGGGAKESTSPYVNQPWRGFCSFLWMHCNTWVPAARVWSFLQMVPAPSMHGTVCSLWSGKSWKMSGVRSTKEQMKWPICSFFMGSIPLKVPPLTTPLFSRCNSWAGGPIVDTGNGNTSLTKPLCHVHVWTSAQ